MGVMEASIRKPEPHSLYICEIEYSIRVGNRNENLLCATVPSNDII
jgi:hypothetical protein